MSSGAIDASAPLFSQRTIDFVVRSMTRLGAQRRDIEDLAQDVMALASLRTQERPDIVVQVNSATHSGEVFAVQHGTQHFASGPKSRDSGERP